MNNAEFWKIIDTTRRKAHDDPDLHIQLVTEALAKLPEREIVEWDRIFGEYWIGAFTWELWGAAFLIGGGCSDDGFMDFRGWLISRGEKVYRAALANPDSLAAVLSEDDECQIEGFQYAAAEAWGKRTGREEAEFPDVSIKHPSDPSGRRIPDKNLPKRFPKLAAKFG